jgi:hypothetical protein
MDDELVGTIPHALRRHQGPLPRPGRRATGWPPSLEQFLTIAGRVVERIERAGVPSGAKRLTVGDNGPGGVPGPELRLTANGARARAISRRIGGAQRRFTIEGSARMGLADARRAAVALPSTLDAGTAPTAERRAARTRAALVRIGIGRAWTLGQLIDGYGAKVAMPARQGPWLARRDHMRREYRDLLDSPVAALDAGAFWHPLDAAAYLQNLTHTTPPAVPACSGG